MGTLGQELRRAFLARKSREEKLTWSAIAREADVPYDWLRQLTADLIKKPDAKKLMRLGPTLGITAERLLALTNQLDVVSQLRGDVDRESSDRGGSAAPDLVAALEAQAAAITKLAGAIESERQERLAWETGLLEAIRDLVAAARTGAAQ